MLLRVWEMVPDWHADTLVTRTLLVLVGIPMATRPCCVPTTDLSPSRKKPIGGHGGVGGSVIIEASRFVKDLTMNTYNYKGDR